MISKFQIEKFQRVKGLNCSMLNNVCDTIIAKDTVRDLLAKCEKLASKTGRKIASVGTLVSKQPDILNSKYVLIVESICNRLSVLSLSLNLLFQATIVKLPVIRYKLARVDEKPVVEFNSGR